MAIYFYTKTDEYGDFSNFSPHGILMNNIWWSTVEHYFQAQKFEDLEQQNRILHAKTPKQASQLGRSREFPLRIDWENVKDEIMYQAVLKKFKTYDSLRKRLLSTGSQEIIENAPGDYYWGCGQTGNGLNRLGKILMRIRLELKN